MLSIVLWQKGENWSYASQHLKKEPPDKKNCTFWYTSCQECKSRPSISWILALLKYKFCKFDKSDLRVFSSICGKDHDSTANPWWCWKELLHPCFCHLCTFYTELMLTDGIAFWWYASLCLLEDTHIYVSSVQHIPHVSL